MKSTGNKSNLIISNAAATRIFLRIASMAGKDVVKGQLMIVVSKIIEGHLDINSARFSEFGEGADEIRILLTKAISRSAKARAAAARRRESAEASVATHVKIERIEKEVKPSVQTVVHASEKCPVPDKVSRKPRKYMKIANKNIRIKRKIPRRR